MAISPELANALSLILGGALVHVVNRFRTTRSPPFRPEKQLTDRVEGQLKKLHDLATDISKLALRIGIMEKWKDEHEAETREHEKEHSSGFARLAVLEEQYRAIIGSQTAIKGGQDQAAQLMEKMLDTTVKMFEDIRDRLSKIEAARAATR